MGVWILTQMRRWGYIENDIDYRAVAEQVYLASDARRIMEELGYEAPAETYRTHTIMGKTFDPADPVGYIDSFAIRRA
jgi:nitrate/nitrite transport system substrate-binding protein